MVSKGVVQEKLELMREHGHGVCGYRESVQGTGSTGKKGVKRMRSSCRGAADVVVQIEDEGDGRRRVEVEEEDGGILGVLQRT